LPLAEWIIHRLVWFYDRFLGTRVDMDSERGVDEGETCFLSDSEIHERLVRAGFRNITRKSFLTQWGLNRLYVGWKD